MALGNLELVRRGVALELDDLHAVEQGLGNGLQRVGGADKEHIGQVVGGVHIVVCEGVVLLGVQNLQQGAGRITVVGDGQLVDLIEHHDGIGDPALLDAVHDPAGHGADVGPAVAADVRLVADAAQAHAGILAVQGPGDALADAGLAGTGGADKAEDGAGLLFFEVHHGDLLDDALLDLLQAEMILLQDRLRLVEVDLLGVLVFPGEAGDKIKIIVEHTGFGTVLALLLVAVEDLLRLLAGGLVHAGLFDLDLETAHIRDVLRMHLVQFLLQIFDLLFDGLLAVDLLIALLLGVPGFIVDVEEFQVFIEDLFHGLASFEAGILLQQGIALLVSDVEPGGHDRRDLADAAPLLRVGARQRTPLELGGVLDDDLFEFFQTLLFIGGVQIILIGLSGHGQLDRVVAVDRDLVEVDAAVRADDKIAAGIDLRDHAGDTDGVEAVLLQVLPAVIGAQHHQDDLFSLKRRPAGHFLICVDPEEDIGIGDNNHVIDGYNCH